MVISGPGANQEALRRHNLGRVLRLVHRAGSVSRAALTAQTGLNRSTVGALVAELVERGLAEETKPVASGAPGRPSPIVRPDPRGVAVLAVDIEVDSLACAVVGLGGEVHTGVRRPRPRGRLTPENTIEDLAALWNAVAPRVSQLEVIGVGVSIVGVVRRDGFVHVVPNLGWREVALADMVDAGLALGVPVSVANEADLGALAEHVRGAGVGVDDLVYLHGEVGVGAGVISAGRPLSGADGYAGEVGHVALNPQGIACRCGSRGCWETEIGEHAILRSTGRTDDGGPEALEAVVSAAAAGDPPTLEGLRRTGTWLGIGVAGLVNLFNPRKIVLGGLFARLYPYLADVVRAELESRALDPVASGVEICLGQLGDDAPLLGAAELVLAPVLEDPTRLPRPRLPAQRRSS